MAAPPSDGKDGMASNLPTVEDRTLRGHTGPVHVVKFNADGRYLLTGGEDRTVVLWNPFRDPPKAEASTGAYIVQEYKAHGYVVMDICISKDNAHFASCGGDRCAYVWDTASGRVTRKQFGHDLALTSVDFNMDGTVLVSGSNDKTVRCWDLRAPSRAAMQTMGDAKDSITRVVVDEAHILASSLDGSLRTYDMRMGKCVEDRLGRAITSFALSNDRNCVLEAVNAGEGTLTLIDRASGNILNTYYGHTNTLYRVIPTFTSSDSHVICGSENGDVHMWDLVDADVRTTVPAHKRVVSCVAHHPSPLTHVMATASFDSTVKVFASPHEDLRALTLRHGEEE